MTKKGKCWFNRYLDNFSQDIYSAYKNPSGRKIVLYEVFRHKYKFAAVIGHNCQSFTVAGLSQDYSKFIVDTYGGHYEFDLNKEERETLNGKLRSTIR